MFDEKQTALVLVVDDDIFMRSMLQNLLEEQGYKVVQAENGEQAIEMFKTCQPDLTLLDAAMPVMDGITACGKIREFDQDTPIIMITSLDDEESVDKAFKAGAVEYITKPVHWTVLRHRVKVVLTARQAENALKASEARFRGLFEQSPMGIALVQLDGQCLYLNPGFCTLLGRTENELQGQTFNNLFDQTNNKVELEYHQELLHGQRRSYQIEKHFTANNNMMQWVKITASLVCDANGQAQFIMYTLENITERKQIRTRRRIATKVFESTSDGVLITDAKGRIIDANQAFLASTGFAYDEVLDKLPSILQSGEHDRAFFTNMWNTAKETGRWRGKVKNKRKTGEIYTVWMSLNAVWGDHNEISHYVAVYSDISSYTEDDERIRVLSHYDMVTHLPNRLLFHELLTRACREEQRLALLYVDLNDFHQLNENYGYDVGDACLELTGKRLRACVRDGDTVSRLENDGFGIIVADLQDRDEVRLLAERIFTSVGANMKLGEYNLRLSCNIGVRFFSGADTQNLPNIVETLMQHADLAMYFAREQGINTYHVFSEIEETENASAA